MLDELEYDEVQELFDEEQIGPEEYDVEIESMDMERRAFLGSMADRHARNHGDDY